MSAELYAYNLTPFFAVIVALALTGLLYRRFPKMRILVLVCFLGVLVSSVVAVNRKASQMANQAHKAVALVPQIVDLARRLPLDGKLVCTIARNQVHSTIQNSLSAFRSPSGQESAS